MTDIAPFVASVLRDKVMAELMEKNEFLNRQVEASGVLRLTGRDGNPVYAEARLDGGNVTLSDPTFFYLHLESKQLLPCPLADLVEVEFYIGGILVGGFLGDHVTGVHLDLYNPNYKVWNFYCDRIAAVTVGIAGWDEQQWSDFLGDNNPRDFMRGLPDITTDPTNKFVNFIGINLPMMNVENSPYMIEILKREKKLMDSVQQNGTIQVTGRYGSPVYAQGTLVTGAFHSADSNVWYVGLDELKQRPCMLADLTGVEVYVGGERFGRFDGEVYADLLDRANVNCKVFDLHPCGLCVATIATYGWTGGSEEEQSSNSGGASFAELPSILANPGNKTVIFQGLSIPVKHVRTLPCMPPILQKNETLLRQHTIRITGRHGQPVYAESTLYDGSLQRNGYSEMIQVNMDDSKQRSRCPLGNVSGVEVWVAGTVTAQFGKADEVFANFVGSHHHHSSDNGGNNTSCLEWELSCEGLAGVTIGIHNWSEDQLIAHLGSSDPRDIGILDLPQILSADVEPAVAGNKFVSFEGIKLRMDDRLKRLLRELEPGSIISTTTTTSSSSSR